MLLPLDRKEAVGWQMGRKGPQLPRYSWAPPQSGCTGLRGGRLAAPVSPLHCSSCSSAPPASQQGSCFSLCCRAAVPKTDTPSIVSVVEWHYLRMNLSVKLKQRAAWVPVEPRKFLVTSCLRWSIFCKARASNQSTALTSPRRYLLSTWSKRLHPITSPAC